MERAYRSLQRNFYFLRGYNLAIDLIAQKFDVPEISVFKADLDGVIQEIQRYNALIPVCYDTIRGTDYQDKDLQARKLQILRDMFPIIDLDALPIPDGNIQKAVELFTDFKAFRGEKTKFEDLLFIMPEGGVDNED